jgi:hypothetical protein
MATETKTSGSPPGSNAARYEQLALFGPLVSELEAEHRRATRLHCLDCGVDTVAINEFYMVTDDVWRAANPSLDGMLCIECLERRLGRTLGPNDFSDAPCNSTFVMSERLRQRMNCAAALATTQSTHAR